MKKIILIIIVLTVISCEEKKIEFLKSNVYPSLFLVKNPPEKDSLVAVIIKDFLLNKSQQEVKESKVFYRYTSDTKYFLDHEEDPGGFSSEEISMYDNEAKLATFFISKCENDTTKTSGVLSFYNRPSNSDIVLYKCD